MRGHLFCVFVFLTGLKIPVSSSGGLGGGVCRVAEEVGGRSFSWSGMTGWEVVGLFVER